MKIPTLALLAPVLGAVAMSAAGAAQRPRGLEPLDATGRVSYFIADGEPGNFVDLHSPSPGEPHVFEMTPRILALVGTTHVTVPPIRISETMRITSDDTDDVWDAALLAIVITRSTLGSITEYAETQLHEVAHATTGAVDGSWQFESVLTDYLGRTSVAAIGQRVVGTN